MDSNDISEYPYEVRERAAIYEYEAGMKREAAEARAIKEWKQSVMAQKAARRDAPAKSGFAS